MSERTQPDPRKVTQKLTKKQPEAFTQHLAPAYKRVGALTFGVGLLAILVGLLIDRAQHTTPIFTVASLLVSLPLVLWLNTRMLRKAIDKAAHEVANEPKGSSQ
jgi:F0F1-type ATP synthase assembly protein I